MSEKKTNVKPLSIIFLVLGLAASIALAYFVLTTSFLGMIPKAVVIGVLCLLDLLCVFIALKKAKKGLQVFLSLLLLLIGGAGSFAFTLINKQTSAIGKIFTGIPETTVRKTVLLVHHPILIIEEIDGKDLKVAFVNSEDTPDFADITETMKEVEERTNSVETEVYPSLGLLYNAWNWTDGKGDPLVRSAILPEEFIETNGEVYRTEVLLSTGTVKHERVEEVSTNLNHDEKPDILKEPFTILIGGNDVRGIRTDEDFLGRSDLSILVTVSPAQKKIHLTVLPRDLFVSNNGHGDRLTYTSLFGIEPWEKAVEDVLGVEVNYYLRFNYSKLEELVDELGGIDIYNRYTVAALQDVKRGDEWVNPGYVFKSGDIHLDGEQTLVYLREFRHLDNGYEDRWKNTEKVMDGIYEKLQTLKGDLFNKEDNLRWINWLSFFEESAASDLDSHDVLSFLFQRVLPSYKDWTYEQVILNAEYEDEFCYTADNEILSCGKIPEGELASVQKEIRDILSK